MPTPETWGGWTTKFLAVLNAPQTDSNLAAIYAIIANEGTSITWNPLAVTGAGIPGNSVGVGNFPDEATGIRATINFLTTAGPNDYPGRIVRPLLAGDGLTALHGFDASGAWSGDFPRAYDSYKLYKANPAIAGPYGASPLLADPGHGLGDAGGVIDITPVPTIGDVMDAVDQLLDVFKSIANFFSVLLQGATWVRIGEIVGGALLIGLAISLINKDIYGTNGKNLIKTAAKVAAL